jgi:hypothetical protein
VWAQALGVPPPIVLATALLFVGIMMLGGVPQQSTSGMWEPFSTLRSTFR